MSGFWEALDRSTKTAPQFSDERQRRLIRAESRAKAFFERLVRDSERLAKLGVEVSIRNRTVSFKRGTLEVLAVTFGTDDGRRVRIVNPVAEYFKLTPSYEDLEIERDVDAAAGAWLGQSIELVESKRDELSILGLL
jgi:hypothetical protein